jgi:tRNA A-37 threonylcarbamoyl transferase component Bud32
MVANSIYAIDFGLSTVSDDNEDRASDLRVFLESLDSHHSEISGRDIFLSHYSEWSNSASVIEALKVLELRGRYNLMRG